MKALKPEAIAMAIKELTRLAQVLENQGGLMSHQLDQINGPMQASHASRIAELIQPHLGALELPLSQLEADKSVLNEVSATIVAHSASGFALLRPTDLARYLNMLCTFVLGELRRRHFMYMDREDVRRFEQPALFGRRVSWAFPSASHDIREVGSCYSTGRYSACVYHCMCAAEVGLHVLGDSVGFKWKPWSTWGRAIRQIQRLISSPLSRVETQGPVFFIRLRSIFGIEVNLRGE